MQNYVIRNYSVISKVHTNSQKMNMRENVGKDMKITLI